MKKKGHAPNYLKSCLLFLLSIGVFLSCASSPAKPLGNAVSRTTQPLSSTCAAIGLLASTQYAPETVFVLDQVLVTGLAPEIDTLILEMQARHGIDLQPLYEIDLHYLNDLPQQPRYANHNDLLPHFPEGRLGEMRIRQYQIQSGHPVEIVVCEINALRSDIEVSVYADPNYLVSTAQWSIEGSPWSQGGAWGAGPGFGRAVESDFLTQPALSEFQHGIGLFDPSGNRLVSPRGAGVRVGVFDTSPFDPNTNEVIGIDVPSPLPYLDLHVRSPQLTTQLQNQLPGSVAINNVSEHGLFISSLLHSIAPESEIHLIRVLEDHGRGDLFSAVQALSTFIDEAHLDIENGTLIGAVINLSLGTHQPFLTENTLPEEIAALETTMHTAVGYGLMIVAAGGNDSSSPMTTNDAQKPAKYPQVLGVAGSTTTGGSSCFSNSGDIAAPGGNGEANCSIPNCELTPEKCLIGRALHSETGYIYWAGTSFATPLVSGQAALLLSMGHPPQDTQSIIVNSATTGADPALGAGIINFPQSLP